MEGILVEMDRGGVLTHGKRQTCAYCQFSNLLARLYRLIRIISSQRRRNCGFTFTTYH